MFNIELQTTLNQAYSLAEKEHHESISLEHLFLALLENASALKVLKGCGVNVSLLKVELKNYLLQPVSINSTSASTFAFDYELKPSLEFQRVLQRAVFQSQSLGKKEVTGAQVLVALFKESRAYSVCLLKKQNISRIDFINYINHNVMPKALINNKDNQLNSGSIMKKIGFNAMIDNEFDQTEKTANPLENFTINLNEKAKAGHIDILIARENEIERTIHILCRRRKNNALLVGDAGVGKTAIAQGLAKMIVDNQVPDILKNSIVYALDLTALLAGTRYRGDFEKRLNALLPYFYDQSKAILFIDEIHTIVGAGAVSGGMMDVSNLIKPLLSSGSLTCLGATTYQEYRRIFEKDQALARRFQKVEIKEPNIDQTCRILNGLKKQFESHHGVYYSQEALRAAAELSEKYITDRRLPDKAIDLLDEAGACQAMYSASSVKIITDKEIEAMLAKTVNIPQKQISLSDKEQLRNLEANLKKVIFGQNQPIEVLSSAIKLARSGLSDQSKPMGSFLFFGPTGVGKTELAKQLSILLGIKYLRFDMSEYMEGHSVSRLIGAPPGYLGYEQSGLLTEAVNQSPHCVLLLDEIEKAHPDIFNILLQMMDHATLTDNNGRAIDFRHVILIMTSNCGAEILERQPIGFASQHHSLDQMMEINKTFSPEFRNRLDAIVQFQALDKETIFYVVDKLLMELKAVLKSKKVDLIIDDSARQYLLINGYNALMGARPMSRLIQEKIKKPLADELLFGQLNQGGAVTVTVKKGELVLLYRKIEEQI